MPYFITDQSDECPNWAVVKSDGEMIGCHMSKDEAIQQMVAISEQEGIEPGGERAKHGPDMYTTEQEALDRAEQLGCEGTHSMDDDGQVIYMPCSTHSDYEAVSRSEDRAEPDSLDQGDFVSWNSSGGRSQGQIERIVRDGDIDVPDSSFTISGTEDDPAALIRVWQEGDDGWAPTDVQVGHKFSTLTKIGSLKRSIREVNLEPPAYMRAAARRGLEFVEEGKGGGGLTEKTIREARAMAAGNVTADKWVRLRAWIARHMGDLDAPAADPDNEGFPSAGVVAHLLWGSGPSKRAAERAMDYANGVVDRLEAEGDRGNRILPAIEKRLYTIREYDMEETEEGMRFEGYAAMFDEPSEPLPFTEKIRKGAFLRSLKSRNDIKLLWNHDSGQVLGSTRAGTMKLVEDERGLKVQATLPNTTTGRDASELMKRGDVDAMSFGFTVPRGGDSWNDEGTERTLEEVMLHEVSIVAFPAYGATAGHAQVRGLAKVAKRADVDVDSLADALLKLETGDEMTDDDTKVLEDVLASVKPEAENTSTADSILELKKAKLKLLEMMNA